MTLPTTYPLDDSNLLPQLSESAHYQPFILRAAEKYSLQPSIIAGLGSRESCWGLALKPKGPQGTGDFGKRKCPTKYRTGPLPTDGGFGRGLLQIDFDAHEFARGGRWKDPQENILYGCQVLGQCLGIIKRKVADGLGDVTTGSIAVAAGLGNMAAGHDAMPSGSGDATTGHAAAAAGHDVVAAGFDDQKILRAALAGYNAGPGRALKAIKEGKDIDHYTTGRDYSADVLNRAGWFQLHGWA